MKKCTKPNTSKRKEEKVIHNNAYSGQTMSMKKMANMQWVGGGDGGEEARGEEDLLTGDVVVDMKRGLSWS